MKSIENTTDPESGNTAAQNKAKTRQDMVAIGQGKTSVVGYSLVEKENQKQ